MIAHNEWVSNKAAIVFTGIANVSGWMISFAQQNINTGAVVTFCTVAVPAMVGAAIYIIKTLGPPILQFLKDRDAVRSQSLGFQMQRLNLNLEDEKRSRERASALLEQTNETLRAMESRAVAAEKRADAAAQHATELTVALKDLTEKIEQGNKRVEDINQKLHKALNDATRNDALRIEAEARIEELQQQINRNRKDIAGTSEKLDNIAHAGEHTAQKVDNIAHAGEQFGATVAEAAAILLPLKNIDPADPQPN